MMIKHPQRDFYPYTWNADEIIVTDVNGDEYQGTHLTLNKPRYSMLLYGYSFQVSTGEWVKGMRMLHTDCIKGIKVLKRGRWYNVPIPEQELTPIPVEFTDGEKKLLSIRELLRMIYHPRRACQG